MSKEKGVGKISNYYGGIYVKKDDDGRFYWGVQDYSDPTEWEEIPEILYNELIKFEEARKK